jgi:adenosyl cobinamide kinase/adenosyl cobinamide phosphate guanylyltransferase/sugar phosphate isomerase/epimerase
VFRIGTTSYIIPDDILPNVRFLAPRVDDVQLVLFETDEYGSNLPDAALRGHLIELAVQNDLTYTVHLPLDLRLGDGGEETHISLVKARRVIEATRELKPHAYTLHLDGRALLAAPTARELAHWQDTGRRALEIVCGWLDEPERLCIENVERWDPEAFAPVVASLPVSRTIDIGHLWLQGADPLEHLARWVGRARVIHLHGIAERDHASLAHLPAERLDPVIAFLAAHFSGVLTLEVFNQADFASSQAALAASLARNGSNSRKGPRNMAKELTLILGGARSGKSTHAQNMALELGGPAVLYVATAQAFDDEMRARIAVHQAERPGGWRTLETPSLVSVALADAVGDARVVLLDCLTLLASNAILSLGEEPTAQAAEAAVDREVSALLAAHRAGAAAWIIVSNEVGLGLVPPYPLAARIATHWVAPTSAWPPRPTGCCSWWRGCR